MDKESGLTATTESSSESLDTLWRQFGKAASEREYCAAWLALQCRTISGVGGGVVLLGTLNEDQPYMLAASWPEGPGDFQHLGDVAERALKDRRGLVLKRQPADGDNTRLRYDIAYPV